MPPSPIAHCSRPFHLVHPVAKRLTLAHAAPRIYCRPSPSRLSVAHMSTTAASSTPEGPVPQSGLSEGSGAHAHAQAQFRCGTLTSPQQAAAADGLASDSGAGNDTVRNPEHAEHAESGASVAKVPAKATGLVMQIILRRDLLTVRSPPSARLIITPPYT
jgi:hypothetical protein